MGAPQHLAMQQSRRLEVRAVLGPAGDLVRAVVTDWAGADNLILRVGKNDVCRHLRPLIYGVGIGKSPLAARMGNPNGNPVEIVPHLSLEAGASGQKLRVYLAGQPQGAFPGTSQF